MTPDQLDELPGWALELLQGANVGHLGLLDNQDRPRVFPVTFALSDNLIYSAIDYKPKRVPSQELARVRFLRRRSQAALTVDRYDENWSKLAWVQILGHIDVVDDPAAKPGALPALRAKYEPYRSRTPKGPLLQLTPARTLYWGAAPGNGASS